MCFNDTFNDNSHETKNLFRVSKNKQYLFHKFRQCIEVVPNKP